MGVASRTRKPYPSGAIDPMVPQTGKTIMPPDEIQGKPQARPFIPFRIILDDGTTYEIRHPELILLGKRSAVIGIVGNPDDRLYDRSVTIALLHITRLEPLETSTAPG
jgi:hypothetical protein